MQLKLAKSANGELSRRSLQKHSLLSNYLGTPFYVNVSAVSSTVPLRGTQCDFLLQTVLKSIYVWLFVPPFHARLQRPSSRVHDLHLVGTWFPSDPKLPSKEP